MTIEDKIDFQTRIEEIRAKIIDKLNSFTINNHSNCMIKTTEIMGLQAEVDILENELEEMEKYETIDGIDEIDLENEALKRMEENDELIEDLEEEYDLSTM
jgi:hypothetical protein